jgi:hypothetical protein
MGNLRPQEVDAVVPVQVAIARYRLAESTAVRTAIHSDTPRVPHDPHSYVHKAA